MKDLLPRHHHEVIHVFGQFIQIRHINNSLGVLTHDIVAVLHRTDVLSSDTHHHFGYFEPRVFFRHFYSCLNTFNGQGDIGDNTALHAQTLAFSDAKNFYFSMLVHAADYGHNFGGTDVQSYGKWGLLCHCTVVTTWFLNRKSRWRRGPSSSSLFAA